MKYTPKFNDVSESKTIRSSNSAIESTLDSVFRAQFPGISKVKNKFNDSWSLEGSCIIPLKDGSDNLRYTIDAVGRQAHFIIQSSEFGRSEFDVIVARDDSAKLVSTLKNYYIKMGYKDVTSSKRVRSCMDVCEEPRDAWSLAVETVAAAFRLLHWVKFLHWSTKGPQFLQNHEALDDYYEQINDDLDAVGEILQRLNAGTTVPTASFDLGILESADCVNFNGERTWTLFCVAVENFVVILNELYGALPEEFHDIASELDSIIFYWNKVVCYKTKQILAGDEECEV